MENSTAQHGTALFVIITLSVIGMIATRLLKSRRSGAAAVKMEIVYLCIYTFMGGALFMYFLTIGPASDWPWGLALLTVFWGGFFMRAWPLFRQMGK